MHTQMGTAHWVTPGLCVPCWTQQETLNSKGCRRMVVSADGDLECEWVTQVGNVLSLKSTFSESSESISSSVDSSSLWPGYRKPSHISGVTDAWGLDSKTGFLAPAGRLRWGESQANTRHVLFCTKRDVIQRSLGRKTQLEVLGTPSSSLYTVTKTNTNKLAHCPRILSHVDSRPGRRTNNT